MIEVGLAAVVGAAATYGVAQWRSSEDEGCNGHHWNDAQPVTEVSLNARRSAGYGKEIVRGTTSGYRTQILGGNVYLNQKAVKRCDDCGTYDTDELLVGSVPLETFEESEDGR